ncbi:MAG: hypothetical protein ACPGVO_14595 [Spirulinaceae cyanobacterium]
MPNTITIDIPDYTYQRLLHTAQATQKNLTEIILRVLEIGSPPDWQDIPPEYQTDVAALDRLPDVDLWQIARSQQTPDQQHRYDELLERNQAGTLTPVEQLELSQHRQDAERLMLCKAQAILLLRWRGHSVMDVQ